MKKKNYFWKDFLYYVITVVVVFVAGIYFSPFIVGEIIDSEVTVAYYQHDVGYACFSGAALYDLQGVMQHEGVHWCVDKYQGYCDDFEHFCEHEGGIVE